ncbi:MAG: type II CAAX endopeptidase family protein [Mobilitalea sp.]
MKNKLKIMIKYAGAVFLPVLALMAIEIVITIIALNLNGLYLQGAYVYLRSVGKEMSILDLLTIPFIENNIDPLNVATYIICIGAFMIWYRKISENSMSKQLVKISSVKKILVIVMVSISSWLLVTGVLSIFFERFQELADNYESWMEGLFTGSPLINALAAVIFAPLMEELVFRGVTLKRAGKIMPFAVANVIQALLFGIIHINIIQGIYAFAFGLILGYIAYKFKSIWASILMHLIFNGLSTIAGFVPILMPNSFLEYLIFAVVGAVVLVAALYGVRNIGKEDILPKLLDKEEMVE